MSVSLLSAQEVVPLVKGQGAPFTGILFTEEKAKSIRQELIEKDGLTKLVASYERTVALQDLNFKLTKEQITILQDTNTRLVKESRLTNLERYMYITLGVVGTSLAVYGAGKLK